jgi:hypothetical protein
MLKESQDIVACDNSGRYNMVQHGDEKALLEMEPNRKSFDLRTERMAGVNGCEL